MGLCGDGLSTHTIKAAVREQCLSGEVQKKKKAAREEDARPDLEYGWEEECRIRHRVLGGGVNPMSNVYLEPLYSTTTNNA
jgi:hypothetical protein